MKRRGFTLVELLVVIVIMGVLSAVAVPKLFGLIAKAKASELGSSAKVYVKLQDAYIGEIHQIGSWALIGYIGPGIKVSSDSSITNIFGYGGGSLKGVTGNGASATINANSDAVTIGWIATSLTALNGVAAGSSWTIAVGSSNVGVVKYTASIPTNAEQLTPNFTQLSR